MKPTISTAFLFSALASATAIPRFSKSLTARQDAPGTATLSVNGSEGIVNGEVILHRLTVNEALPPRVWGVSLIASQGGNLTTDQVNCHAFSDTQGMYGWGDTFTIGKYEDWPEFSDVYGPAAIGSYLCGSLAEINAWFSSE